MELRCALSFPSVSYLLSVVIETPSFWAVSEMESGALSVKCLRSSILKKRFLPSGLTAVILPERSQRLTVSIDTPSILAASEI